MGGQNAKLKWQLSFDHNQMLSRTSTASTEGGEVKQQEAQYSVQPGRALGPFNLGEKVSDSLAKLRSLPSGGSFEVRYPQEPPLDAGIVVVDLHAGIELLFDCHSQRLVSITARDPCAVQLTHKGVGLSSGDGSMPTFAKTYDSFGPTFPGEYAPQRGGYLLSYAGVSFVFPIPAQYQSLCCGPDQLPLELPDGTTPVASQLQVHHQAANENGADQQPAAELDLVYGSVALGSIQLTSLDSPIQFGAAAQEVQFLLGPPAAVCHKPASGSDPNAADHQKPSYLYNYFELGLDLGFCGETHTVNKFIMHSNQPGHRDFNTYHKCMFEVAVAGGDSHVIGSESLWGEAESVLGEPQGGRPVINSAMSATSPFGPTKFYGYEQGLIVEVMDNGQLASVTMYQVR